MTGLLRVALPGYNAATETDPDHFALLSDEDWVLIKEQMRGSVNIAGSTTEVITHSLGYIPLVFVFGKLTADIWSMVFGSSGSIAAQIEVTTTTLRIRNNSATTKPFKYYIFYDQQV